MTDLDQKFFPPADMPDFHRPFWDGLKDRRLLVQRCANGHLRFIPTEICSKCGSQDWTWEPMSGRGEIYTYTVIHRAPTPAYQAEVPYVVAHVALEEGPRMISNIVGCEPGSVAIGMPVEVVFEDVSEEWTLYQFKPRAI